MEQPSPSKDEVIDGITFKITKLLGRASLRMSHQIGSALMPAVTIAADNGSLTGMDMETLSKAVAQLFRDLPENKLDSMINAFFSNVVAIVEGKPVDVVKSFDLLFQGRTSTVYKLLYACVMFTYEDFTGGSIASLLAKLPAVMQANSKGSLKTSGSAGPSGDSSTPAGVSSPT